MCDSADNPLLLKDVICTKKSGQQTASRLEMAAVAPKIVTVW